jgi:heat shock protein HtpX
MGNILKTFLLLLVLTVIFMFVGERLGGSQGMALGLIVAVVMNFASYWFSDKIVLAMYKARDPQPAERRVEPLLRNLATQAGLPMPGLKVIDTDLPNAFATGRNPQHAVVAVTTGILARLNDRELTAVLAHELTHVRNRDILISTVAASLAGAITFAARMAMFFGGGQDRDRGGALGTLLLLVLAPLAAILVQMAVSRSREYDADRGAGLLTQRPLDLVAALEKLQTAVAQRPAEATAATANTAHLFIVNPFKGGGLMTLFSTHPSLEQRAARLQDLVRELQGVPKGI